MSLSSGGPLAGPQSGSLRCSSATFLGRPPARVGKWHKGASEGGCPGVLTNINGSVPFDLARPVDGVGFMGQCPLRRGRDGWDLYMGGGREYEVGWMERK